MAKSKIRKASKNKNPHGSDDQSSSARAISDALNTALQHQQAGRLAQAKQIYHQILQQQEQFDALHGLGMIAYQSGNFEEAVAHFQKALALSPNDINIHNSIGVTLKEQGKLAESAAHLRVAIALNPNNFMAYTNLGNVLREQGQLQEAISNLQRALRLSPNYAVAHNGLGVALQEQGKLESAFTHLSLAIALNPNSAEIHNNFGSVLQEQGKLQEAATHFCQAIALEPNNFMAYTNFGVVLRQQGQLEAAVLNFQRSLALNPNASAHNGLGATLWEQNKLTEAFIHWRQAIDIDPNYAEPHYNSACLLLLVGDLRRGFAEYEWRWLANRWAQVSFTQPLWNGSDLEGKTILLYHEQGFGDTIQFIRYAALVNARHGRVIATCQPSLKRLLVTVPGIEQLLVPGEPLPEFQVHAPLLSLPWILQTTLETVPAQNPYLAPPTDIHLRLQPLPGTKLQVGIVWASGYRQEKIDLLNIYQQKSCPLSVYARLFSIPGISFYSLQVGHNAGDIAQLDSGHQLQDLSHQIKDFADTAALIAQMDLVITVDTAVAHLAGALGKPVWVLLSFLADWRWLLERQDSPWYPTMRLFRQQRPDEWTEVLDQVAEVLKSLADECLHSLPPTPDP